MSSWTVRTVVTGLVLGGLIAGVPAAPTASAAAPLVDRAASVAPSLTGWTVVSDLTPTTPGWRWAGDAEHAEAVGYAEPVGQQPRRKRLYYQFGTAALRGTVVTSATFRVYETATRTCTPTEVSLLHVAAVTSSTTWATQPSVIPSSPGGVVGTRSVALGRAGCQRGGGWVSFDATAAVRDAVAKGRALTAFRLQAADESDPAAWKKFRNDATLTVELDRAPATPTALRLAAPPAPCAVGPTRPVLPNDPPTLVARLDDADPGDLLTATFELGLLTGAATTTLTTTVSPGTDAAVDTGQAFPLPDGLAEGTYRWRVRSDDGTAVSAWSDYCEFTVDRVAPETPTLTPDAATASLLAAGAVPVGTTLTWSVGGASADVVSVATSVDSTVPGAKEAFRGTVSVAAVAGPHTVRVWLYDAAGNRSAAADATFSGRSLALPADLRAAWSFEGAAGTAGVTAERTGRWPLGLSGATGGAPGVVGTGLAFAATARSSAVTGSAAGAPRLIDLSRPVSVIGWMTPDPTAARAVLLSADGTAGPVLTLEQRTVGTERRVVATLRTTGSGTPVVVEVPAPLRLGAGTWYRVGVSWNPGARTLSVFTVDVDLFETSEASAVTSSPAVPADGTLRLGAARSSTGTLTGFWTGTLDEVAVLDYPLTAADLLSLPGRI